MNDTLETPPSDIDENTFRAVGDHLFHLVPMICDDIAEASDAATENHTSEKPISVFIDDKGQYYILLAALRRIYDCQIDVREVDHKYASHVYVPSPSIGIYLLKSDVTLDQVQDTSSMSVRLR